MAARNNDHYAWFLRCALQRGRAAVPWRSLARRLLVLATDWPSWPALLAPLVQRPRHALWPGDHNTAALKERPVRTNTAFSTYLLAAGWLCIRVTVRNLNKNLYFFHFFIFSYFFPFLSFLFFLIFFFFSVFSIFFLVFYVFFHLFIFVSLWPQLRQWIILHLWRVRCTDRNYNNIILEWNVEPIVNLDHFAEGSCTYIIFDHLRYKDLIFTYCT